MRTLLDRLIRLLFGDATRRALEETLADWETERLAAPTRRERLRRLASALAGCVRIAVRAVAPEREPDPNPHATGRPRGWRDAAIADLRIAIRSLQRSPWFTGTAVATIWLSMVLAATTFAVVDGVLFKPLPYPAASRLFAVYGGMPNPRQRHLAFSPKDLSDWRAVPGIAFSAFESSGTIGTLGDSTRPLRMAAVDAQFFDVIGQRPLIGGFSAEHFEATGNALRPILLTHGVWQSAFGSDRSVIGRVLTTPMAQRLVIMGVLPLDFVFPTTSAREVPDVLTTLALDPASRANPAYRRLYGVARLDPSSVLETTGAQLSAVARAHAADIKDSSGKPLGFQDVVLESLVEKMGLYERSGFRLAFAAAAGLVFLACVNIAGLIAARGRERARELAVRVALGARRRDLLRLFVFESALVGLAGGAMGAALAPAALAAVASLLPETLLYLKTPSVDWRVVTFALVAGTATVMVMTLPAIAITVRAGLRDRLASAGGSTTPARTAGRFALLATQTSIGMVLVLGGALLIASVIRLAAEETGFNARDTARIEVLSPKLAELLQRVRGVPGVVDVAATGMSMLNGSHVEFAYGLPAGTPKPEGWALRTVGVNGFEVTAGFFAVAGLRLIDGRLPTQAEFDTDQPVVIVSDVFAAKYWPRGVAVGQTLERAAGQERMHKHPAVTVIGVVADARFQSLDESLPSGELYLPLGEPTRTSRFNLLLRTEGEPGAIAQDAARHVRQWDTRVSVVAAESLRASLWRSVRPRTFSAVLYGGLGAAALLLVAVGVGGLVATSVARRVREIGIRIALGADRARVRRMVVVESARPVVVGLALGALASYWTAALAASSLYGTTPYDWKVWLATVATVLAAAATAAYVPARRASFVDPTVALREL